MPRHQAAAQEAERALAATYADAERAARSAAELAQFGVPGEAANGPQTIHRQTCSTAGGPEQLTGALTEELLADHFSKVEVVAKALKRPVQAAGHPGSQGLKRYLVRPIYPPIRAARPSPSKNNGSPLDIHL